MINGLPPEFKLKLKGEVVGFQKDEVILGYIEVLHRRVNETEWKATLDDQTENSIWHDLKCQWTGYFDIHKEKIYFGDELKDKTGNIFVVKMDNGQIIGAISAFFIDNKWAGQFEDMELEK